MVRGRLRIYLGAAPGVGKTVAMLQEGRRRVSRGTDVVVGACDTHGRPYTASLLEGLEVVPNSRGQQAGTPSGALELDLDAVLARRPQVVLVDDLASANVSGSVHRKRWEDVQQLLDAGIDVISTLDIQHLESLGDVVASITGVVEPQSVPDEFVRRADQIDLVDMSPEALRRRMAHGNVYPPDRVDAALSDYFRLGNLSALRELALLWLADRVEAGMERYRSDHGITRTWPTRERVVVALVGPEAEILLRRGARIASRMRNGSLLAVCVVGSGAQPSIPEERIPELRHLAEDLGGEFHTVAGDDPAQAVLDFARGVNATQILVGRPQSSPWRRGGRSMAETVIAGSGDMDVLVVTPAETVLGFRPRTQGGLAQWRVVTGGVLAVLLPLLVGSVVALSTARPGLQLIIPVYLLITVVVATMGGLWPAVVAAVTSSLLLNWFFVPPVGTFGIADPENALALGIFVLVGVTVALIVHRNARRTAEAEAAQRESAIMAELSHSLLGSTDQLQLLLQKSVDSFGVTAAALVRRASEGQAETLYATPGFDVGQPYDQAAVDEEHLLVLQPPGLAADQRRLFSAFAGNAGSILQRLALQQTARTAAQLARDNAARTALLSAVSHDLRTPLAGIKAAIGSLRSTEVEWSPQDEDELKEAIEVSADRLDALIGNLLDMSRLQTGHLVAHPRPIDLGELVPATLAHLSEPGRVEWTIPPDARSVVADPGLLDRVLGNVTENALRYQPAETPVRIQAGRVGDRVEIRVVDTGVGVPDADQERIFLPFQRQGDVPRGEGVGLGLAVARGFAEAMAGTITAENTPGGGLTVVTSLPTRPQQDAGPDSQGQR